MANIIVDADANEMVRSNRLVVRDANDFVYVFVNANGNIRAYKADVAGEPTSFTEQDAVGAPAIGTDRESLSVAIDSAGLVHMLYMDTQTGRGSPPLSIRYATFGTSAHATSQDEWVIINEQIAQPVLGSAGDNISNQVGIAIDANDDPHVIWSEITNAAGNTTDQIRYNNKIGGTWNAIVAVDSVTNDNFSGADIMIGDPLSAVNADRPIIITSRDLSGVLGSIHAHYGGALNATSFTEEADITDATGVGINVFGLGFAGNNISVAIDSNEKITIAFVEHTTKDLMIIEHLNANAWTVWETPADVDTSSDYEFPSIAIDGTDRLIFILDKTNADVNLWKDLGAGWVEETDHDDLPNVGTFDYPLVKWAGKNNNNSDQFDYVFKDASGVLYNTFPAFPIPPPPAGVLVSGQHAIPVIDADDPLGNPKFRLDKEHEKEVQAVLDEKKPRPFVLPRREQKIPYEFAFKTQSALLIRKELKFKIKSAIKVTEKFNFKIKSPILKKFKETYGIKASTLIKELRTSFKLKSCTLTLKKVQVGLFANMESLTKQQYKKKKEFLLRKLKEVLDEDGR